MSSEVLQSKSEIDKARSELRRRGLSCTGSKWPQFLRKLGLSKAISVGDTMKSWDVLKTSQFIETKVKKDSAVLDIGAFASEILCILHRLGYSRLTGVDLNPHINRMPYAENIRYVVSDFMHTPFKDGSFDVITSTSVIEHGFNSAVLLTEASRLLSPGGYFIASFDYWPEKIDTTGVFFFGMDWMIFSQQEVMTFIDEARAYNFVPCGDIHLSGKERPIECAGRKYTFAWLALQKNLNKK